MQHSLQVVELTKIIHEIHSHSTIVIYGFGVGFCFDLFFLFKKISHPI